MVEGDGGQEKNHVHVQELQKHKLGLVPYVLESGEFWRRLFWFPSSE